MYWLSSGLLIPVMVAVLFFLVRALMLIGNMYGLYTMRLKLNKALDSPLKTLNKNNWTDLTTLATKFQNTTTGKTLSSLMEDKESSTRREKLIADFELWCEKDLDKSRTLSKMGPILGLMGTLIPMGPALAGLAAGDIATMSQQMQIAFNTTVLGLVIGSIGFISLQLKQRWYAEDLNTIEFVNDLIEEENA
ncbi:MotA/TolQ/ExbB proton channel family protein [Olivibacter sitiensis]|uniref:MotA/TolQ/ExbB proton channel family protein n=1 Tax=Olivibacter sitiensis TaxID=376470 RepID=UPI001B7FAA2C|nr:MotA/TolQ/ExbB proton channel family protein [Olivibacter sitiensis]